MTLIPVDSSRCEGNDMNKHARLPRLGANDNKNSNYNRNNINSKEITRIMMLMLLRRMINTPTRKGSSQKHARTSMPVSRLLEFVSTSCV